MRSYVAAIALVGLAGLLGYRQWTLERRVAELTRQLGTASAAVESSAAPAAAASDSSRSHTERLRALEASLASARADIRSLETATGDLPQDKRVTDQQILSVMKEHGAKVMENQLKFHRERWLEQREVGLAEFSRRFGLNQQQSDSLWGLLSSEIDKIQEILRKPESFEDPERAAAQWKQVLLDTDSGAHKVLEPQNAVAWDQARFVERKLLWPWLPD